LTIAALVQGGLVGTAMAVHATQDDHDALRHEKCAGIELIMHGHDHDRGTPEHEHSFVSANPAPQHIKRNDLQDPPHAISSAVVSWTPRISLSSHRRTELCGPSPPSLNQTFVVLRI
jgi:hypothetical protein